jgi:hypothetical protein
MTSGSEGPPNIFRCGIRALVESVIPIFRPRIHPTRPSRCICRGQEAPRGPVADDVGAGWRAASLCRMGSLEETLLYFMRTLRGAWVSHVTLARRRAAMNMIRRRLMLAMAVLTVVAGAVQRAPAGVMLVTSPTALAPNDSIDWGQLGPDSTSLPSSTAVTSATGLVATVSTADPTGLLRVDEGLSWIGNFTISDHLITNNQTSYFPLTIGFASPVSGAGAQIQLDNAGPFTATITAFSGTNSLGTFTENGLSTALEDGSAIFIGVSDTKAEITSIVFGIDDPPAVSGDFAINSLLIRGVPEPSSLVLAAIAVPVGLGVWWRRRRQAARTRAE